MGEPHKWAEVIKAAADGKDVQRRHQGGWETQAGEYALANWPWMNSQDHRIKPEPVYPVTRMSGDELYLMYLHDKNKGSESVVVVVNAAIRRAIEDGDVILPNKD